MTTALADVAAAAYDVLAGAVVDLASLSAADDNGLRDAVQTMQTVSNAAQALQADALAEMGRRAQASDKAALSDLGLQRHSAEEFLVDEIALLLSITKASASRLYARALRTVGSEPIMRGWRGGRIDAGKAEAIVGTHDLCRPSLDPVDLDALMVAAVDYGGRRTAPQLREWLRRRELAIDPQSAERRRQQALLERRVVIRPADDGMSELWALLPSVRARTIQQVLDRAAHDSGSSDARTMDQRRADALVELVTGEIDPSSVSVHVVVPSTTLDGSSELPGWLMGVGPVTAPEARELADAGTESLKQVVLRRLLADPVTGTLTDLSETRYRPSPALARAVRARDVTCRFPGCRRSAVGPANGTDLDHTVPWPVGSTSATNLAVLCRRHHRLKHTPGWSTVLHPDGSMTWTTPTGRQFNSEPWAYLDPGEGAGPAPTQRE